MWIVPIRLRSWFAAFALVATLLAMLEHESLILQADGPSSVAATPAGLDAADSPASGPTLGAAFVDGGTEGTFRVEGALFRMLPPARHHTPLPRERPAARPRWIQAVDTARRAAGASIVGVVVLNL